ncbi:hypothetical protein ABZ883_04655 [Streptomyces sp. NPDC046977]|uniref:hypothetical protein n=1 Tax=Streptomyces sp. NPDC046977 TaxID=3154703 RepID=UPI0033CF2CE0
MTASEPLSPEQRQQITALIGDAQPTTNALLVRIAESVRDRREHDHTSQREDWYCLNLVGFMGERMAPVLRRLLDAEARIAELETDAVRLQQIADREHKAFLDTHNALNLVVQDAQRLVAEKGVEDLVAERDKLREQVAREQRRVRLCRDKQKELRAQIAEQKTLAAPAAERDCLAMAVLFALQWTPDAPMTLREGIEEILSTMPQAPAASSAAAPRPAVPPLGATCAACGHAANWHNAICTAGKKPCGCPQFVTADATSEGAGLPRFCGADLARTQWPFTCYRPIGHGGLCAPPDPDSDVTFYRAACNTEIAPLGWYTTEAEARKHCEDEARAHHGPDAPLTFSWPDPDPDDPDAPQDLTVHLRGRVQPVEYTVHPVTAARRFDPDADR